MAGQSRQLVRGIEAVGLLFRSDEHVGLAREGVEPNQEEARITQVQGREIPIVENADSGSRTSREMSSP